MDQRAGMFGLDAVPDADSPMDGMDDPGPQQPPAASARPRETPSFGATAPAAPAPPAPPGPRPAPRTTDRAAAGRPPGATERTNVFASGPDSEAWRRQLDRADRARPFVGPAPDATARAFERSPDTSIDHTTSAPGDRTRRSRSADQRNVDARRFGETPRLEPQPRPGPAPPGMPAASVEPTAEPDAPDGPRLTIGRIDVEVVPEGPEPAPTPPARQGPLTAASVSIIGPLSPRVRASRHSSLRYR
jgi:hypothetical protein